MQAINFSVSVFYRFTMIKDLMELFYDNSYGFVEGDFQCVRPSEEEAYRMSSYIQTTLGENIIRPEEFRFIHFGERDLAEVLHLLHDVSGHKPTFAVYLILRTDSIDSFPTAVFRL